MGVNIIEENLKQINHNINEALAKYRSSNDVIKLMAVTKTVPFEKVNIAISNGVSLLGENRVQEFLSKKDYYDKSQNLDIHFIGSLQTNKVKYIVGEVSVIQSVDSLKLASEINKRSEQKGIKTGILIEINTGEEDSKSGITADKTVEFLESLIEFDSLVIRGLMTIPPPQTGEYYFEKTHELFYKVKDKYKNIDTLSMGMSDDYIEAIKHGATLVRIGSGLFGSRG